MAAESPYAAQQPQFAQALVDLRTARRRKRLKDIHWIDAFYRVYLSALLGVIALIAVSGFVGGQKLDAAAMARVLERGPALLGLATALAVGIGLRSGSRGGPIALEGPDVRHVLMSPLDRGYALRAPAVRQLRFSVFIGAVVGAAAGIFAYRRLGHNPVAFAAAGGLYGAVTASLGVSVALLTSGRRVPKWLATLVALLLVAWSAADAADKVGHIHSPTNFAGRIGLWPMHFAPWGIVAVVVAVVAGVLGLRWISGLQIEAAERRTALVGQLRFAVTMQDLRTVLVLRRQLAMELPREHPWFAEGSTRPVRFTATHRAWKGVLRWPAARLVRLLLLAAVAGFAMRGAWNGTLPLVVLAGLALWIGALDGVEAMAQETDHPSLRDSYPIERGLLYLRQLWTPVLVMVVVAVVAGAVGVLTGPTKGALVVAAIAVIPAAVAAMAGAAVSVVAGAPKLGSTEGALSAMQTFAPPEFAGATSIVRSAIPPGIAVIGCLPLLAARGAYQNGKPVLGPELAAAGGVLVVVLVAVWWVRMHERVHDWWVTLTEEAAAQQKQRTHARDEARERVRGDD